MNVVHARARARARSLSAEKENNAGRMWHDVRVCIRFDIDFDKLSTNLAYRQKTLTRLRVCRTACTRLKCTVINMYFRRMPARARCSFARNIFMRPVNPPPLYPIPYFCGEKVETSRESITFYFSINSKKLVAIVLTVLIKP